MKRIRQLALIVVFAIVSQGMYAQFTVTGQVNDEFGDPLIGVTVTVLGSTIGTFTDIDGKYSLDVAIEAGKLEFSYIGYRSLTMEISADDNQINVVMEPDITSLDEVVVTGLASNIKRSNLANAISTISGDQLTGVTTQQTVDGALYGKLTGVNIVQSNGAPGGGIAMRLRGVSSLSGNNQPLWIIDGVYMSNAEIPSGARFASGANSGTEEGSANRIADLNPADIESIEILKGASAAAIYGTRANAGVVIVRTKRGTAGKTSISFNQDFGINTIQNFVGRKQYTAAEVGEVFGDAEQAKFSAAQAAGKIYDYEKEIYGETGFITDSKITISGGNSKTQFFLGGNLRDEDGIIKNTGFNRKSLRLNVSHELNDKMNFSLNTNYINSFSSRSFTGNENEGGLSYGYTLAFTRDWIDLFPNEDGVYPNNPNYSGNPIFVRDNAKNEESVNRFIAGGSFEWQLMQKDNQVLKLTLGGGTDFFLDETNVYVPETHQSQAGLDNGFIGVGNNRFTNSNYQAFLNHSIYTAGNVNFSTQAGISYLNFKRNFVFAQATQLIPLQTSLTQGGTQEITETDELEEEFGMIVQEEVNFDDKIIATAGVRFDKSSLNGDPNKYYFFPRASVAVNVANFDFWNAQNIDQFKLRIAYGQTGSSATYGSLFTSLNPTNIGGATGFSINPQQGNPLLEPEQSSELEFGADISLFNRKLGLEATYYIRNVTDLLYDRSLPTSSGFSNEIRNDLDLKNTGIEIALTARPVSTANLSWNSSLNFWLNRSEITRLGVPAFVPPGVGFGFGLGTFYMNQGTSITAFWGRDSDGNPTIIGETEPDFQLSWYNSFTMGKNLSANFLLHLKQGGDNLNLSRLLTDIGGTTPDEDADLEGFIEDASYLRLREIGLYYTLPGVINNSGDIKFGVSARNLFTLTSYSSYDPETSTKGGAGLSTGLEVTPFPSSKQVYFHIGFNF